MKLSGRTLYGWRWIIAPILLLAALATPAEPTVYHDRFDYVVPELMLDKMIELAPIKSWMHFPEQQFPKLTKFIDADDDGAADFVAIALATIEGGFGAQIRYRLSPAENGGEAEIGPWYWCVITDGSGKKIFEQFNP